MDNLQKSKLASDIENSLDDFFGERNPEPPKSPTGTDKSLEKLKSAVLSIDWEITDECLSDLIRETDALLPVYQKDQATHALMRMLRALSRYIQKRKAQAHQDAIKRVMSVFNSIESLVGDRELDEPARKRLVAKEIAAFKKLKEQIEMQQDSGAASTAAARAVDMPAHSETFAGNQQFHDALNEMEKRLTAQIELLKSQLNAMKREIEHLRQG